MSGRKPATEHEAEGKLGPAGAALGMPWTGPDSEDGARRYGRVCSSCQRGWWWRAQRSVTVPSIMARAVPG